MLSETTTEDEKRELASRHALVSWGRHLATDPLTGELRMWYYRARILSYRSPLHPREGVRIAELGRELFADLYYDITSMPARSYLNCLVSF